MFIFSKYIDININTSIDYMPENKLFFVTSAIPFFRVIIIISYRETFLRAHHTDLHRGYEIM